MAHSIDGWSGLFTKVSVIKKTYKKAVRGVTILDSNKQTPYAICSLHWIVDFLKKCYERHLGDDLEIFSGKCLLDNTMKHVANFSP